MTKYYIYIFQSLKKHRIYILLLHWINALLHCLARKFEDIKGIMRSPQSKKDRQYNDKKKDRQYNVNTMTKRQWTNTHIDTKHWKLTIKQHKPYQKTQRFSSCSGRVRSSAPYIAPVVINIRDKVESNHKL